MKLKSFVLLFLLAAPSFGDTVDPEACPLTGAAQGVPQDCEARRLAFRDAVQACIVRLHDEANLRAGHVSTGSPQSSRSRFLICDAATRKSMEIASK
ncbi:hypothetical protein NX862_17585 [Rhodobacter sp. KR11]|uniref:hypothetical protein n=1 Tax=Rhodobacter sp. KR11 TaxID=2974588 RepID=UPI00222215DC|nr:hypothetical protein [Rhodobacter sp. KR11]MCW1920573.1 hypothetical protein [Rhodobacter sp. KR11]